MALVHIAVSFFLILLQLDQCSCAGGCQWDSPQANTRFGGGTALGKRITYSISNPDEMNGNTYEENVALCKEDCVNNYQCTEVTFSPTSWAKQECWITGNAALSSSSGWFTIEMTCDTADNWTELPRGDSSNISSFDPATDLIQYQLNKTSSWQGTSYFYIYTHLYSADSSSYIGVVKIRYSLSGDSVTSSSYVYLYTPEGGSCYNRTVLQEYGRVAQQLSWNFTADAADILTLDGNVTVSFTGCRDSQYEAWETLVNSGRIARVTHYFGTSNVPVDNLTVKTRVPQHRSACSIPQIENGRVSPNRTIGEGEAFYFSCDDGYILNGNSSSECTDNGTLSNIIPSCSAPTPTPTPTPAPTPDEGPWDFLHEYKGRAITWELIEEITNRWQILEDFVGEDVSENLISHLNRYHR